MQLFRIKFRLLLFLLLASQQTFASHAAGAEFTYESIGSNQYLVTYTFYRDCYGIPAPANINLVISNSCGAANPIVVLPMITVTPQVITTTCPTSATSCNGGSFTGIEKYEYQGVVTFSSPCENWTISYSEPSRNVAITTIVDPSTLELFVYCVINNLDAPLNNSPRFASPPFVFVYMNTNNCNSPGTYDPDGDSLSYQIITPRTGPDPVVDVVTYIPGYSATQPLLSTPPCTFNSFNGDFCCHPTMSDVTVLAVLISEYRNGILIGQVERDMQFNVIQVTNYIPGLTGFNGSSAFTVQSCPGFPLHTFVASTDPNASDTTQIQLNNNTLPGGVFTNSGGRRDSLKLDWTPNLADTSSSPYTFLAEVLDNACPYVGISMRSYSVTVLPPSDPYCISLSSNTDLIEKSLKVFPNPAESILRIEYDQVHNLKKVEILDLEGRKVKSETPSIKSMHQYYIGDLNPGIYMLRLKFDSGEVFRKFVKSN